MVDGLKSGENCVWIALEEPVLQIKKTALEHNWDLTAYEKQGKLKFVDAPLIDASTDKLLYPILNAVNGIGAKRVVIDSISTLESATPDEDKVRELWIQLSTFFKTIGVTCVVNYTSPEMFGAEKKQFFSGRKTTEPRISSLMDAIIVLKYVERERSVRKLLNVLKLRGSKHSKDIFEFEIDKDGFKLGEKFKV
jgi:circadian clock protein KaiC